MPNWKLSWHHLSLNIADIWQAGVTGKGTTVAVLDTGLALPEGLDRGNCEALDPRGRPISPYDPNGHGTFCASLIASYLGGALGVAPEARVLGFRVLDTGNDAENVETALDHILRDRPEVDVVSCSFIISQASQKLQETVRALANSGRVVVAAAGNRRGEPADFPEQTQDALTIAAVDAAARPLSGAQVGPWIDLAAPGVELPAVAPGVGRLVLFGESSAAAAVTSGIAALALSSCAPGTARQRLGLALDGLMKATATPIAGVAPETVGAGLINPTALLKAAAEL